MFFMPLWMGKKIGRLFTLFISICALIAEIFIGITLFNVWIGLSFWLVALIISTLIINEFPYSNPMISLILGIVFISFALFLLY